MGARPGVPAERGWCHTKGGFCHLIWRSRAAFHPPWSKARGTPCHTVPCHPWLLPRGRAAATLRRWRLPVAFA